MQSVTSNAVARQLGMYTKQLTNRIATQFGYTAGSTVSFEDFVNKVVSLYGEGFYNIKFLWADAQAFYLSFGNGVTFITSGGQMSGYFEGNANWRTNTFWWLNASFQVYKLYKYSTTGATTTGAIAVST